MLNLHFDVGDRVISRGVITRDYGVGKITDIDRNVATVCFDGGRIETYNVAMLRCATDKQVLARRQG